jgi:tetratricopeptide (TPR) repeat protein
MKRAFSLFFIILNLLTFKNVAFAQSEVEWCYNKGSYVKWCFGYYNSRYYEIAIEYGKLAVKHYPNNPAAHYCLGLGYYAVGEFKLALKHVKRAESLTSNKKDLMYIYNQIGLIYDRMGYFDDALLYYSKSLSLVRNLRDIEMEAQVLINIALTYENKALLYKNKGELDKAVEYFQKAIEIGIMYGNYHLASKGALNLGDTYRRMKDYEKAEKYLLEGLEAVKKVRDKYWEATGYKYLGWLYRDKMDKKTAQNYFIRYRDLDWLYKNKRGKNTAEDYLIRAYILYKSIGKEKEAKEVLSDMRELKKER